MSRLSTIVRLLFAIPILLLLLVVSGANSQIFAIQLQFSQEPNRIIIPALELSLPIQTAKVAYNTWEVSNTTASFGQFTTLPGNAGNTVIFAHARKGLFADLPQLQVGDTIHLYTKTDWFVYQVTEVDVVEPSNTEVIFSNGGYELTLFTCVGAGDSHRFVVKARLLSR